MLLDPRKRPSLAEKISSFVEYFEEFIGLVVVTDIPQIDLR